MALCYKCRREIPFIDFWKAFFESYQKQQYKSKAINLMQTFKCPCCGVEEQQTYFSTYGILLSITILIGGIIGLIKDAQSSSLTQNFIYLISFLGCTVIVNFLWWKYFSVLREPKE